MSGRPDALNARPARTRADVVQRMEGCTLIRCQLFTGRNHQIRVHLSEIGHPILGDEFYGAFGSLRSTAEYDPEESRQRHALHAASLSFMHPILRSWMKFETSPPDDFWNTATGLSARR
jgi:23S rRNA pseudouridine1911/1915/1917 synthase